MRLTVSVLARELLDIEVSSDTSTDTEERLTFGFHASGTGVLEMADDPRDPMDIP